MLDYLMFFIFFSIKILFTFDNEFYKGFNGANGKPAEEYIAQLIALIKNAFKDKSLVSRIGTSVNIIAETKKYDGSFIHNGL